MDGFKKQFDYYDILEAISYGRRQGVSMAFKEDKKFDEKEFINQLIVNHKRNRELKRN